MSLVSRNYASGLFLAAAEQKEETLAALEEFCLAMEKSAELKLFLQNPAVPGAAKKAAVKQLLRPDTPAIAANFLCLLIDKRRIGFLSDIFEDYRGMVAREANVLILTVTSARELSGQQKEQIADHYRRRYKAARVQLENRVAENLVGGIKIKVGDMLTDDSISGRLRKLAAAISC